MWRLPYGAGQICVRKDLIAKELFSLQERYSNTFSQQKLTNRFLDWLFRRYETWETAIYFYDSEPEIPDDATRAEIFELFRNHEERRMTFNNWIDVIGEGIWDMSQRDADRQSKDLMIDFRQSSVKKKDRIYYMNTGDFAVIYCYGRDFSGADYWFMLKKKGLDL